MSAVRRILTERRQISGDVMEESLVMKLIEHIPENQPISVHQLTCRSGLDHRTIKKYLGLIMEIQDARRVVKTQVGLRFMIKKEK